MPVDPVAIARACYEAYVAKDRAAIEALIAPGFHFTSPLDNRIDRATYFERCWPNSRNLEGFEFIHLLEASGRVFRHLRRPQRQRPSFPEHRDPDDRRRADHRRRGVLRLVDTAPGGRGTLRRSGAELRTQSNENAVEHALNATGHETPSAILWPRGQP